MQFAGQRTDMDLNPIGKPHNYLIKLSEDVLPDPDAVLITGITPQATIAEGITEAEFLKIFIAQIASPDTIFVGFNSIRFDDEFMRFLHYRNYYDAYEWQWKDGRSKWDILDVVRMTRALRPHGIKWPVDSKGQPANRLTLLTSINGLDHAKAHDALNDVQATIALARLLRDKQPKLFDYLLQIRDKKKIADLAHGGKPFVYTSGKYSSQHEKTTVVSTIADHPRRQGVLVYDLRHDPTPFLNMTPADLVEAWKFSKDENKLRLPVKSMQFNRCPAVAPLAVFNVECQERLHLTLELVNTNLKKLQAAQGFGDNILQALEILDKHQQASFLQDETEVDAQLYDGFIGDTDKPRMQTVRNTIPAELKNIAVAFQDSRLSALLPLYKARNFPQILSAEEREMWEQFRRRKLLGGKSGNSSSLSGLRVEGRAATYFERLGQLAEQQGLSAEKRYLLEELQLYGQSILPVTD